MKLIFAASPQTILRVRLKAKTRLLTIGLVHPSAATYLPTDYTCFNELAL